MRIYDWAMEQMLYHRTVILEAILAVEAVVCGLWILLDGGPSFGGVALFRHTPEPLVGVLLVAHGLASAYALWRRDVQLCRRSALASAGLWSAFFVVFLASPPDTLFTLPLVLGFACMSAWVYMRLHMLWPPRRRLEHAA